MTKSEFATRLLFWLLPWPISKALPKALRIYYFGPAAEPPSVWPTLPPVPPGWLPNPEEPLPPGWPPTMFPPPGFEPSPEEPLPPGWDPTPLPPPNWLPNPVYPQPPDWDPGVPPPPDFIHDPSNPYIPGPGYPPPATHPHVPGCCEQYCDDNFWEPGHEWVYWIGYVWKARCTYEAGTLLNVKTGTTWATGFRPSYFRMFFTGAATSLYLAIGPDQLSDPTYTSGKIAALTFTTFDILDLEFDSIECHEGDFILIQSIEFW